MKVIIPMVGLSSRFIKEGYTLPKYMLQAGRDTLFSLSIKSFQKYFDQYEFIFVFRNIYDTKSFLVKECDRIGLFNYKLIELANVTSGQAETVKIAIESELKTNGIEDEIIIFNIDTALVNFNFPNFNTIPDGFLEVFIGVGDHWSFVKPLADNSPKVKFTTEKVRVSKYCSNGLYYFNSMSLFLEAYENTYLNSANPNETYVAPMYNYLINSGKIILYTLSQNDNNIFLGTPSEYLFYLSNIFSQNKIND